MNWLIAHCRNIFNKIRHINFLFYLLPLAVLILVVYQKLFYSFFQQDEWLTLGGFINSQDNGGYFKFLSNTIKLSGDVHVVPLTVARSYLQIGIFQLNFSLYALMSVINHIINTFLVVYLAIIIFKKRLPALICGLIFGLSSIASQAVVWMAPSINTQNSTTFLLLSLIFFLKFIKNQNNKKYLISTLVMVIVGLLFKESVFFLFLFFPILLFISVKSRRDAFKASLLFIFPGLIYFLFRVPSYISSLSHSYGNISSIGINTEFLSYIFRLLILPFRIIPQSLIPNDIVIWLSDNILRFIYPHLFMAEDGSVDGIVRESVAFDLSSLILGFLVFAISIFAYKSYILRKDQESAKLILFSLLFIVFSGLPLILISDSPGFSSILEPRHLYIATIGSSIFITILLMNLFKGRKKLFFYTFLTFILLWNVKSIISEISYHQESGRIRQKILSAIQEKYPRIPEKVIFYVESDTTYYGLPESERILPFQSGFGQTLLVWYSFHSNRFPSCFFSDTFLYAIDNEGYRFCQNRGFGYFRKMDSLKKAIDENEFKLEDLISFKWIGDQNKLIDITLEAREEIKRAANN